MAGRFRRRFELSQDDVQRLMDCIVEHARPGEARDVERLLGMLGTIPAPRADDDPVAFSPPRGTEELVDRALEAMARSDRHEARARRARVS